MESQIAFDREDQAVPARELLQRPESLEDLTSLDDPRHDLVVIKIPVSYTHLDVYKRQPLRQVSAHLMRGALEHFGSWCALSS